MKRTSKTFFAVLLCLVLGLCFCLAACGNPNTDEGTTPPATGGEQTTPTPSDPTPPPSNPMPTSAEVVSAIKKQADAAEQNYDFVLKLAGNINVGSFVSPDANAVYTCSYRYNRDTEALRFKRETSGILLYDSTEYIYSSGDSRITVKMKDATTVKKVITDYEDTELHLINLPFASLVESLSANEITEIEKDGNGYSAQLKLTAQNAILNKICSLVAKMDTSISLKGVTFTNPISGIDFKFNLSNGALAGYSLSASVSVPVKGVTVTLNLSYEMTPNSSAVNVPATNGFLTDKTEIATELSAIHAALESVKNSDVYALDLEASNDMDPGWNVTGTKDSLQSRLYKHTDEAGFTSFNNSFEYHSHHETQGKETYKYTYGNVTDDEFDTYYISRKGTNSYENAEGVTADTRFEFMTDLFNITAQQTDCIRKESASGTDTYTIYLSDSGVVGLMKGIVQKLNGNAADGVVSVDNYFNDDDHTIENAEFIVVMKAGALVSMELDTEIKYNPVQGDYTENNVTLKNKLSLTVNDKDRLEKAQKYTAPKKAKATAGVFGGLDYILDVGK